MVGINLPPAFVESIKQADQETKVFWSDLVCAMAEAFDEKYCEEAKMEKPKTENRALTAEAHKLWIYVEWLN